MKKIDTATSCRNPQGLSWKMMPEGPECKRIGDALQLYAGWTIKGVEILSGRYRTGEPPKGLASFSEQLLPAVIQRVGTKGKFIYIICTSECGQRNGSIWNTLGMTGHWALSAEPHSRVRLDLESPDGRWHPIAVYSPSGRPFSPAADRAADAVIEGFRVRHVTDRVATGLHFVDQCNFGTLRFRPAPSPPGAGGARRPREATARRVAPCAPRAKKDSRERGGGLSELDDQANCGPVRPFGVSRVRKPPAKPPARREQMHGHEKLRRGQPVHDRFEIPPVATDSDLVHSPSYPGRLSRRGFRDSRRRRRRRAGY